MKPNKFTSSLRLTDLLLPNFLTTDLKDFTEKSFQNNPYEYVEAFIQCISQDKSYIEYTERLKKLFFDLYGAPNPNSLFYMQEKLASWNWLKHIEIEYRKSKNLTTEDSLSPKEIYEFALKLYKGDRHHD